MCKHANFHVLMSLSEFLVFFLQSTQKAIFKGKQTLSGLRSFLDVKCTGKIQNSRHREEQIIKCETNLCVFQGTLIIMEEFTS